MTTSTKKQNRAEKRAEERQLLEAAFQRLLALDPADPQLNSEELLDVLRETGRVPVTQDNVALEAGLSRKLITGADCPFPDLAARIKAVRPTHGVAPTTTAQLDELRNGLAQAKQTIVVLRSKTADAMLRADRAETELKHEKALTIRLRKQIATRGR